MRRVKILRQLGRTATIKTHCDVEPRRRASVRDSQYSDLPTGSIIAVPTNGLPNHETLLQVRIVLLAADEVQQERLIYGLDAFPADVGGRVGDLGAGGVLFESSCFGVG